MGACNSRSTNELPVAYGGCESVTSRVQPAFGVELAAFARIIAKLVIGLGSAAELVTRLGPTRVCTDIGCVIVGVTG